VELMYPNQIDAVTAPQLNEFRLNILNVPSLGVSSFACSISAFSGRTQLGITPLSAVESISVVNSKQSNTIMYIYLTTCNRIMEYCILSKNWYPH
jgi:hypothetical protein